MTWVLLAMLTPTWAIQARYPMRDEAQCTQVAAEAARAAIQKDIAWVCLPREWAPR